MQFKKDDFPETLGRAPLPHLPKLGRVLLLVALGARLLHLRLRLLNVFSGISAWVTTPTLTSTSSEHLLWYQRMGYCTDIDFHKLGLSHDELPVFPEVVPACMCCSSDSPSDVPIDGGIPSSEDHRQGSRPVSYFSRRPKSQGTSRFASS